MSNKLFCLPSKDALCREGKIVVFVFSLDCPLNLYFYFLIVFIVQCFMQEPWWSSSQCMFERVKTKYHRSVKKHGCPAPSIYGPWAVCLLLQTIAVFFASDGVKCLCVVTLDTGSLNPPGFSELFLSCSVWHLSLCSTAVSSKAQESHTCLCFLLTCRHSNPGTCLGARYSNYSQTHPAN